MEVDCLSRYLHSSGTRKVGTGRIYLVGGFIHHASYNTNFDTYYTYYYIVYQYRAQAIFYYLMIKVKSYSCVVTSIHNSQQKCNSIPDDELNFVLTKLLCISIFMRGGISVEICVSQFSLYIIGLVRQDILCGRYVIFNY